MEETIEISSERKLSDQQIQNIGAVKEKMKNIWTNGDFGVIAKSLMPAAEKFVNSLEIIPASKVLDVACGSGNLALAAAKNGAKTKGLDLVPDLIRQSSARAQEAYLDIDFTVGDAEDMPYPDSEFDYVITMFGAMFCPRPELAAAELFRVCKPGGIVAMINWTQRGFSQDFFGTIRGFSPPSPAGLVSPNLWGEEEIVFSRLKGIANDITYSRERLEMRFPVTVEHTADIFINYYGPTKTVNDSLDEAGKNEFRTAIIKVFNTYNVSGNDSTTAIEGEYLKVSAVKA